MLRVLSYVFAALFALVSVNAIAAKHMAGEKGAGAEKKAAKGEKKAAKGEKKVAKGEKKAAKADKK